MTQPQTVTQEDLFVSITIHNFSASTLKDFIQKIVKPYFNGNMNQAVHSLMQKAIEEERIVNKAVRLRQG
ncbi:MAG: hypothetical protein NWE98_08005 [Candidatus Bathyarchaeota archaeon]|nr:hypothetical protein [Candidatus Bathyarchaeota archaeon]